MSKWFDDGKVGYYELQQEMRRRHNATLADQAAGAIWDFEFALSILCLRQPSFDEEGVFAIESTYVRLIRGLR